MPEGCGDIDFPDSDLWSLAPYMKGACFYEGLADVIGAEALDAAIAEFSTAHAGSAARREDMLDLLAARVEADQRGAIDTLVDERLHSLACPEDYAARCRSRGE